MPPQTLQQSLSIHSADQSKIAVVCGDADRTLFCMYAPFSHFYAARLIKRALPLAPAPGRAVRPARSHTSLSGGTRSFARSDPVPRSSADS